ncbi:MAG: nicotinamide riboside transporter PnuC [Prevotella sp.]|nr:nicotinamide riboside transporter PnuC [Prevotella sp.]
MDTYQILDIIGSIVGLVYIYQEYKASIWLWMTGIIMPVIYMFVYYEAGLYADFGMQIYYALAAIYGFLYWKYGRKKGTESREIPITHYPRRFILPSLVIFLVLWGVLYIILSRFTNSTVPILDSFGNALSFIGLWALAKKYLEQWWIWIVVDLELSALYVYKGIPFTAGLYALYTVIAVMGYFKWKREISPKNVILPLPRKKEPDGMIAGKEGKEDEKE